MSVKLAFPSNSDKECYCQMINRVPVGHWPIPEPFWIDSNTVEWVARKSIPEISISRVPSKEVSTIDQLNICRKVDIPVDTYDPSIPLTKSASGSTVTGFKDLGPNKEDTFLISVKGSGSNKDYASTK